MPKTTLLGLCFECGHAFNTYVKKPRCAKCGSRRILKATPDEIITYVEEKAREEQKTLVLKDIPGAKLREIAGEYILHNKSDSTYQQQLNWLSDRHGIPESQAPDVLRLIVERMI